MAVFGSSIIVQLYVSSGVTAARLEAIFDQPFPKPSHSIQLFLILPLLLLLHLLLGLAVLLPIATSSQPTPWNLSPKGHRASVLVTISGMVRSANNQKKKLHILLQLLQKLPPGITIQKGLQETSKPQSPVVQQQGTSSFTIQVSSLSTLL